ncbi:MAG: hypothetical protein JXA52_06695 [Planctomycetes bacterium]|nr:hypothetical protein [Planctomycetota bacterium]
MKTPAYKLGFVICLSVLALLGGCGDQRVAYLPPTASGNTPCVKSNPAFLEEGNCERANLNAGFLKAYLLKISYANNVTLLDEAKVEVALPHIKQALADYGNASFTGVFAEGIVTKKITLTVQHGHLVGSYFGDDKGSRKELDFYGKISPVPIPLEAYEPLE